MIDEPLGFDPADDDAPPEAGPDVASIAATMAGDAAAARAPDADGEPDADASLVALVERLGITLSSTDLVELEVEAGSTALVLRKPAALAFDRPAIVLAAPTGATAAPFLPVGAAPSGDPGTGAGSASSSAAQAGAPSAASVQDAEAVAPSRYRPIAAPLTGIFYSAPSPGAAPYVEVGEEIAIGQVVGLIEAMKLFNEIKSDVAGRVVRVVAENGALVKAKHPLLEVDPR